MVPDANSVTVVGMPNGPEHALCYQKEPDLRDQNVDNLPFFAALGEGKLAHVMIQAYHQAGVLILEYIESRRVCDELRGLSPDH